MNTNSKITEEQIAEGWIEIESAGQLIRAEGGHFDALSKTGEVTHFVRFAGYNNWHSIGKSVGPYEMVENFIAYRPLPSYEEHSMALQENQGAKNYLRHYRQQQEDLIKRVAESLGNQPTLRDQFAMAAMPAISIHSSPDTIKKTARRAYDLADAMLEARKGGYEVIE